MGVCGGVWRGSVVWGCGSVVCGVGVWVWG